MKYVMLQDENLGRWPFIFPDMLIHEEVAKAMRALMLRDCSLHTRAVSAGFWDETSKTTFGQSTTLGLAASEVDALYITYGEAVRYMPPEMLQNLDTQLKGEKK